MTNIEKLFSGVCVIVDDAFGKEGSTDNILKIKKSIEDKNIPVLAYPDLPDNTQIKHYKGLNFVILDWDINPIEDGAQLEGVQIGDAAKVAQQDNLISFIKELNKQAYIPIFIFSQQDIDTIKRRLIAEELYVEGRPTNIFIKSKSDLLDTVDNQNVLFGEIEKWLKATPSVYVLKEWETAVKTAKRDLFWSFNDVHHEWPSVLIKAIEADGADSDHELSGLIFKNIIARTATIEFDEAIIKASTGSIGKDDIRKVLENERYLTKKYIPNKPSAGCLFKISDGGTCYYLLNIRPDCDVIRDKNPDLYCIKGVIVDENKINTGEQDGIVFERGELREKITSAYVACIDEAKIIEFSLRKICVKKWNDLKEQMIGKILPPYITRIQQRHAFYIHRQGVPGLPAEIL